MVVAVLIITVITVLFIFAALIGSFLRTRDSSRLPPAWNGGFSAEQHEHFVNHLRVTIQSRGLQAAISHGSISIATGISARELPLTDFAQACHDRPESEWDEQIDQQLARLTADYEMPDLAHFDAVKDLLALQLGIPPGLPPQSVVAREYLLGIRPSWC